ncbi:hypothetical protein PUN28_017251 [Cardiocondyla obscurior]|uniref:50S ribosomal protein L15e n=1 Tax=Cardiocondyla obscurior TaxID=286306 RepID=A0AAW2EQU6_9HYME
MKVWPDYRAFARTKYGRAEYYCELLKRRRGSIRSGNRKYTPRKGGKGKWGRSGGEARRDIALCGEVA